MHPLDPAPHQYTAQLNLVDRRATSMSKLRKRPAQVVWCSSQTHHPGALGYCLLDSLGGSVWADDLVVLVHRSKDMAVI